jgi:hypothetical protein
LTWIEPDQKFTVFYTNLEEGLRYTAWRAIFTGKGLNKNTEEEPELQTMQVIKMVTNTLIEKTAFSYLQSLIQAPSTKTVKIHPNTHKGHKTQ